jgi:hypothetical protein
MRRPLISKRNILVTRFRKMDRLKRKYRPHRGGGGEHGSETDTEPEPEPEPGGNAGSPIGLLFLITKAS